MSVLTNIGGMPLFSTVGEALAWGNSRNLTGYHTHVFNNQTGYMGGATHAVATGSSTSTTNTTSTSSSGSSSGGGGGY
tara:strand:- start:241 stop:474 length:234 start_codon:yes stop_codon:yes gene_type:complete